ncbi:MAG: hypothetical protein RL338_1287 [Chloroflexota bacterium]
MGGFETLRAEGAPVRAYTASTPGFVRHGRPGIVLFHAWWGLNDDVVSHGERLAALGYGVVAPDMFDGEVATTVDRAEALASGADESRCEAIALAAVDRLAELAGPMARLAAVGFSFGAPWALLAPARRPRVVATVLWYGTSGGSILGATSAPVLGHFAEDDPYESEDGVADFERTLRDAGRDVTLHRYPGTGHWFAEPSQPAYDRAAAELAFDRTAAFLRERLR